MKKLTMLSALFLATIMVTPTISEATAADNADSKAHVTFEANTTDVTPPVLPVDPEDPGTDGTGNTDNTGTGNKGPLSIDYVTNVQFGLQKISGGTTTYTAKNETPYIQVTDNRGTGAGWSLTASASEFSGDNKGETVVLKGAILSLNNGVATPVAGNLSTAPTVSKVLFDNTDTKSVMTAEKMQGMGTFLDVFEGKDVTLEVPGGVAISDVDYSASVTWVLGDTPLG